MKRASGRIHPIWNKDTGIKDFEVNPEDLRAPGISGIRERWKALQQKLKGSAQFLDFMERLGREWAIETGIIEGLYDIDRSVNQTLIKEGFQRRFFVQDAIYPSPELVLQLLRDQKDTFYGLYDFVKHERELSTSCIKELQVSLLRSQESIEGKDAFGRNRDLPLIKGVWKMQENNPVRDGVTYTYCPPEHVASEMDRLMDLYSDHVRAGVSGEVLAAWLHHRFTQIHPFQDGNRRVARALASLVLLENGLFPLVITRDDRKEYIKALEWADQGELAPLVHIITQSQLRYIRKASRIAEEIFNEEHMLR